MLCGFAFAVEAAAGKTARVDLNKGANMRHTYSTFRIFKIVLAIPFCTAIGHAAWLQAGENGDQFKPGTVWKGGFCHNKTDYFEASGPAPVILYVKKRNGTKVEVMMWYPKATNRLVLLTGKIMNGGKVKLNEKKVIHDDFRIMPANEFSGQLKCGEFHGTWEWVGPNFNGPITGKFNLKLAK